MLGTMNGKQPESDETIYVRHLIVEATKTLSMVAFHRLLQRYGEVSRPHLVNIRDGDRGIGLDVEKIFAAKYHGGDINKFREAAKKYADQHRPPQANDPYPSRPATLVFAVSAGFSPEIVKLVATYRLPPGHPDPGARWWYKILELTAAAGALPPAPPPLETEPVTPVAWPNWKDAFEALLIDRKLFKYWPAAVGYSRTPAAATPPERLDKRTLLRLLDEFLRVLPRETRRDHWREWTREARQLSEKLRARHPQTKRDRDRQSGIPPRMRPPAPKA